MRALFWLLLLGWLIWMISRLRRPAPPSATKDSPAIQDMVACGRCGLHLPKRDAVQGARGAYCSIEHRAAANDHNPG